MSTPNSPISISDYTQVFIHRFPMSNQITMQHDNGDEAKN